MHSKNVLPMPKRKVHRASAIAVAAFTAASAFCVVRSTQSIAQTARTVQIDGDAVLAGRAMDPRFDKVLRAVNQYAYVVVNPANGPEAVDGLDLDADGYAGPNPNVEDFVLRAKRLGSPTGTRVLGYLPKERGDSTALSYRRIGVDGVFLAGYTCTEASAAIATISTSWTGATIVIGTPGCSGGSASVNTADPAQYTLVDASASNVAVGSLDPYSGYPVAGSPKLGIPAYFTDPASWDRLLSGIGDVGAVVINQSDLTAHRNKVQAARAGGAKIYAYVPTGYLTKSPVNSALASGRIASAVADPDIDGVFLDEVRSGCSDKAVVDYTAMYNQTVAAGKQLVYNPGQTAGSCFNGISNASVNFEGTFASYGNWPASEWGRTLPENKTWQILHTATPGDIATAANLAKQRNAGLIWIAPSDHWADFPDATYFAAVRLAVRGTLTPPAATTTSAPTTTSVTTTTSATTTTASATTTATPGPSTTITQLPPGATTSGPGAATTTTAPTNAPTTTSTSNPNSAGTTTPTTSAPPKASTAAALSDLTTTVANVAPAAAINSADAAKLPVAPRAKAKRVRGLSYTG